MTQKRFDGLKLFSFSPPGDIGSDYYSCFCVPVNTLAKYFALFFIVGGILLFGFAIHFVNELKIVSGAVCVISGIALLMGHLYKQWGFYLPMVIYVGVTIFYNIITGTIDLVPQIVALLKQPETVEPEVAADSPTFLFYVFKFLLVIFGIIVFRIFVRAMQFVYKY